MSGAARRLVDEQRRVRVDRALPDRHLAARRGQIDLPRVVQPRRTARLLGDLERERIDPLRALDRQRRRDWKLELGLDIRSPALGQP